MKTEMTLLQVADLIKRGEPTIVHTPTFGDAERLLSLCAELIPQSRFNGTLPQYIGYWNKYGAETYYRFPRRETVRYGTIGLYENYYGYSPYTIVELLDEEDGDEIADFDMTALMQML